MPNIKNNHFIIYWVLSSALFLNCGGLKAANESDWKTLLKTGKVERRLDVAMIAVGYESKNEIIAERRAEKVIEGFLEIEPFVNYKRYINIHFLFLKKSSGLNLGVRLKDNILTCDGEEAAEMAQTAPDADIVMVLTNIENGRSTATGKVITLASKGGMDDVFIHEMGHAFGGLADEYEDDVIAKQRVLTDADRCVNTTTLSDPKICKWHYWCLPRWNGAHMSSLLPKGHLITHREGGHYFSRGVYRPETNCRMRDSRTKQFCLVCSEELEKQFFVHIDPIQTSWPLMDELLLWKGQSQIISASVIDVKASGGKIGKFITTWYVDGEEIRSKSSNKETEINFRADQFLPGLHEVALRVDFVNGNVRRDSGWLSSSRVWTVRISHHDQPQFELKSNYKCFDDSPLEIKNVLDDNSKTIMTLNWLGLPNGAILNGNNWSWAVPVDTYGAWDVWAKAKIGNMVEVRKTILSASRAVNRSPIFNLPSTFELPQGLPWKWTYAEGDPDGDHLSLTVDGMPEGMNYDPVEKTITWTPNPQQSSCQLSMSLYDGASRVVRRTDLIIKDRVRSEDEKLGDEIALRSPSRNTRYKALQLLGRQGPISSQLLQCTRLLRDEEPVISQYANDVLIKVLNTQPLYREMFFNDVEPYLWDLCDRPKVLWWVKQEALKEGRSKSSMIKTIESIEDYNRDRGVWAP